METSSPLTVVQVLDELLQGLKLTRGSGWNPPYPFLWFLILPQSETSIVVVDFPAMDAAKIGPPVIEHAQSVVQEGSHDEGSSLMQEAVLPGDSSPANAYVLSFRLEDEGMSVEIIEGRRSATPPPFPDCSPSLYHEIDPSLD